MDSVGGGVAVEVQEDLDDDEDDAEVESYDQTGQMRESWNDLKELQNLELPQILVHEMEYWNSVVA